MCLGGVDVRVLNGKKNETIFNFRKAMHEADILSLHLSQERYN